MPSLTNKQLILTANNRLRNHLLRSYVQECERQGQTSITSPRVYTFQQWFDQQWQALQGQGWAPAFTPIATALQRQWLWQEIIQNSSLAAGLLQAAPLAQSADAALHNLELWQLDEEDIKATEPLMTTSSNSYNFLAWLGEFRARLTQLGLITQEEAVKSLIQAFKQQGIDKEPLIEKEPLILLLGFDDIPPLHQQLLQVASDKLEPTIAHSNRSQLYRTQCSQAEEEMLAAALWSREQLIANPNAMIGIIVPNLGQCRNALEQAFTQVFEPLAALPDQPRFTLPFNFSAGIPLATCPLMAATLDFLGLHDKQWPLETICQLLSSPFWGDADNETVLRTYLIAALKQQGRFLISAGDLRYHAQRLATQLPSTANIQFAQRLVHLEAQRHATFGKHSASYWSDFFYQLLQSIGWPGQRRLDSQEHQQLSLWNQLIEQFNQLDSCKVQLTYAQARQELRNIAGKTPFQAQTPLSPIQILGALEAAGLEFSHCWVMGLHHRQWPPTPSPNPLLPIYLQRQHKMPHASAERELLFARSLTQAYRRCAPVVVFSSASHDADQELSPSALIRDIPFTAVEKLLAKHRSDAELFEKSVFESQRLEFIVDNRGPDVDLSGEKIRGGASIFKEQASCPFNAFARLRLDARAPDAPVPGFSAIERGNMLHYALATLWRSLKNQQTLLATPAEQLKQLIDDCVAESVTLVQNRRGNSVGHFYAGLEKERLTQLITEWMELEKQRPNFQVITTEESLEVTFAGLPLSLRIDRIDQLDNGDLLLIDYKTGQCKPQQWLGDKPEEPQLPLYALVTSNTPAAISFAQINAKNLQWLGTGKLEIAHPGITTHRDWPEQLREWQRVLSQLAQDFITGDARLEFSSIKAQDYADELLPLNRLAEQDLIEKYLAKQ